MATAAQIIDGTEVARTIRAAIQKEVAALGHKPKPGLAVVLIGENPASKVYVRIKRKMCEEAGIYSEEHKLPETVSPEEALALIRRLNTDRKIHGILVQLPLPAHLDTERILSEVAEEKDVDGFSTVSIGKLASGNEEAVPCTPKGVIRLLEHTGIPIEGQHAVVVGRSGIVGKPTALMLLNRNATVTVCHSKTKDLASITRTADILVAAIGRPKMITAAMIKKGAAVIDVGTTKVDGNLVGDVDFESAKTTAGWITPVPGGVGPMTVAMLLENTLEKYRQLEQEKEPKK